jgi:branched-chain amino acid transport system substrate-binding protein
MAPTPSAARKWWRNSPTSMGVTLAFGTLFSHVVIGSAPRAGELKMPYFVVSEGHHVASPAC